MRVNSTTSGDINLTCGVPRGLVLGQLLFIVTVDSLSKQLNCIPYLLHGFFADDLTIVCTSSDLSEIQQISQQGLDCITNWSAECCMEVLAMKKTEYTLFGARETNLLSLKVGETEMKEERAPKLLGLTMQPHKVLSKHVLCMKAAANTRLLQLRAVASPEWCPEREKLRAFYLAQVQAKMCHGVASWWFDTSLSDRERLERVKAQAAHMVAGIPKAANRDDALREARLKPINEPVHRRALENYLPLKAKGPDVREGRAKHLPSRAPDSCQACDGAAHWLHGKAVRRDGVAAGQACPLQHHRAGRPQGGRAKEGQEGAHHVACSGSGISAIRCGRTGRWCWMSRQEPVQWCTRRMVGVRRWGFELGRLPAAIARWKRC
ncbi:putative Reverse transcriptase (RNA dependent DNA polymerase) [Trypanosoma vivax]|nr:putative Reverse transcriptase (RNA dependent DNA polymerase) [Trypanosoma vivax]